MQKDHILVPINSGVDTNTLAVHHKKSFRRVSDPHFYLIQSFDTDVFTCK